MYTTIEADIEDGKIVKSDTYPLPDKAHVLITFLSLDKTTGLPDKKYDFSALEGHLSWTGNAVNEQRKLRDEW